MACFHPFHAFPTGRLNDNGKRELIIDYSGHLDRMPQSVALRKGIPVLGDLLVYFPIPCGSCIGCRADKARAWSDRLQAELSITSKPSWFVTLTYDDDHLPSDRKLRKGDLQLFHKRMRKAFGPFRFFACGEYGERTHRAHYHSIYIGLDIPDLVRISSDPFTICFRLLRCLVYGVSAMLRSVLLAPHPVRMLRVTLIKSWVLMIALF